MNESIRKGIETRRKNGNFIVSAETRKKMSDSHKKNPQRFWLGKKMPKELRKKLSESHKGLVVGHKWVKGHKPWNFGKKLSQKTRDKMSVARRGFKRTETTKNRQREGMIKFMSKNGHKWCDTDIELLIEKELLKNKLVFLKQQPIGGISLVDFYLPNHKIVIECDGDYWHNRQGVPERDREKTKRMQALGYKVFRFKGSEIKESSSNCIKKLCV